MQQSKKITFRSRAKSFGYAIAGLRRLIVQEPNMRIHLIATVMALAAGVIRHIDNLQWIALIFAIALVWITEAFNTALETLCDLLCDNQFHPTIKIIKDISAAAVFIAAMASVIIAVFIFL